MKRLTISIILGLVLVLSMVGSALAITNGQPDGDNHPYVGLLIFDPPDVSTGRWRCSGSLIAPNVVLTAGHCTDGAVAARVWFVEKLQNPDGSFTVPDYPAGGVVAVEGTPYTNPDYRSPENPYGGGNGLPAFSYRDTGIVVLDTPVYMDEYAQLPEAGLVDTLKNKTPVDFVGYGVTNQVKLFPGQSPRARWTGLRNRMYAPSELVSGEFVHSAEYLKLALNASSGSGGTCFGDSGGPDLLGGTNTVLGVNSYVTNVNCSGVGYSARVDIPEVLEWIEGFLE
jgi:hypothetical protein